MTKFATKKYRNLLGSSRSFGVDLNNAEMKIFQIESRKKKHRVVGWNRVRLPKEMVGDDLTINDSKGFVTLLEQMVAESQGKKISGSSVVLSIPESKIFLRVISMPLMSEKEAEESIKWEVESNIPISVESTYFDWQIVEKEKNSMKVLIAAAAKPIIDNITDVFEHSRFQIRAIEADSIAVGRSLLANNEKTPTLVIDIGTDGTGYFIYNQGYPVFSSTGSISGNLFTDSLVKYYGISWEKAEQYKTRIGLGSTRKEKDEMTKLFGPLLSTLASDIEKTINFFEENLDKGEERSIDKVIVCGGGSNLKGIIPFLSISLKKKVVQGNPWQNISLTEKIPPISIKDAQSYVTAIGLALKCSMDKK